MSLYKRTKGTMTSSIELATPRKRPISRALEEELRRELNDGLRVWLDRDGIYTDFVDQLAQTNVPCVSYRGSFLQMMFDLEGKSDGITDEPLLIHLPGFNEDDVRNTPVLAHYEAGKRYRRKLQTLIENTAASKVDPDDIAEFAPNAASLQEADEWMWERIQAVGNPLKGFHLHEIWQRLQSGDGADLGGEPDDILNHLKLKTSMRKEWFTGSGLEEQYHSLESRSQKLSVLADILLSWAMAVEYVADLKHERQPVTPALLELLTLNAAYREPCLDLTEFVRSNPKFGGVYTRVANDLEQKLAAEKEAQSAADLGEIDTFLFEDERAMKDSLERLLEGDGAQVLEWAETRRPESSIWLRRSDARADAWSMIRAAARLEVAIEQHADPLAHALGIAEALGQYEKKLWRVDLLHRQMEQKRRALTSQSPNFSALRTTMDAIRGRYHDWADVAAKRFSALCEKDSFIPASDRQQRETFEQDVRPLYHANRRLVYMVLDGFRFEMAKDLAERLDDGEQKELRVKARMAELPSITSVGMNVLAPVSTSGALHPKMTGSDSNPKFGGFALGTYHVMNPETRKRAMYKHVGGNACPLLSLDEVHESDNLKKRIASFGLTVVHALEIDDVGEVGQGTAAFDSILMKVASAIRLLRKAGAHRFVITADHGFLLEPPVEGIDVNGRSGARYKLSTTPYTSPELVSVPLADLKYQGTSLHAVFPRDTRSFTVPGGARNYVHGGNSLQERVVPVMTIDYQRLGGGSGDSFELQVAPEERKTEHRHAVKLKLLRDQHALLYAAGNERVEIQLQALDDEARLEVLKIDSGGRVEGESTVSILAGKDYEVDFRIWGPSDSRSRIRVFAPTRNEEIAAVELEDFFNVLGEAGDRQPAPEATPAQSPTPTSKQASDELSTQTSGGVRSNLQAIEDEAVRKVFDFIERHGAISEGDATQILGSPRRFRTFSRNIDDYLSLLSFRVRTEMTGTEKRYVKEQ